MTRDAGGDPDAGMRRNRIVRAHHHHFPTKWGPAPLTLQNERASGGDPKAAAFNDKPCFSKC